MQSPTSPPPPLWACLQSCKVPTPARSWVRPGEPACHPSHHQPNHSMEGTKNWYWTSTKGISKVISGLTTPGSRIKSGSKSWGRKLSSHSLEKIYFVESKTIFVCKKGAAVFLVSTWQLSLKWWGNTQKLISYGETWKECRLQAPSPLDRPPVTKSWWKYNNSSP